jgi:NADH:ubiquinone oxidoreductase subunit 6 (subunit J)
MLLRWLLLVPFALICALAAGFCTFLLASVFDPVLARLTGETLFVGFWAFIDTIFVVEDPSLVIEGTVAGLGELLFTFFVAAPVFVALAGEIVGTRSLIWYAGASAVLSGAMPWLMRDADAGTPEELHVSIALGLTGAVAGLVYWMIAGRGVGQGARSMSSERIPDGH